MIAAAADEPEQGAEGLADLPQEAGAGHAAPASEATEAEAEELRTDKEATAPAAPEAEQAGADLELAEVLAQRDEYLDALRRLKAEFENYRKRVLREQHDQRERAGQQVVAALLGAFDATVTHRPPPP